MPVRRRAPLASYSRTTSETVAAAERPDDRTAAERPKVAGELGTATAKVPPGAPPVKSRHAAWSVPVGGASMRAADCEGTGPFGYVVAASHAPLASPVASEKLLKSQPPGPKVESAWPAPLARPPSASDAPAAAICGRPVRPAVGSAAGPASVASATPGEPALSHARVASRYGGSPGTVGNCVSWSQYQPSCVNGAVAVAIVVEAPATRCVSAKPLAPAAMETARELFASE